MCLATAYKPFVMPILDELLEGISSNTDGSGFTIATKTGQLITEHAVGVPRYHETTWTDKAGTVRACTRAVIDTTQQEMLAERFVELRKRHPEGPAMFHSRYATGGVEDLRGCHPYRVAGSGQTTLIHNGVMFSVPQGDWRSDTRIFAEDILPRKFRKFWRPGVKTQMEAFLGAGNKIAIITVDQRQMTRQRGMLSRDPFELFIFNERSGMYTPEGAWHSNSGYKGYGRFRSYTYGEDYDYEWSGKGTGGLYGTDGMYGDGWLSHAAATADEPTGDVKESHYLDRCDLCAAWAVDPVTRVCSTCDTCNDCIQVSLECECYTPEQATQPAQIKAITSGVRPLPMPEIGESDEERQAGIAERALGKYDPDYGDEDDLVVGMSWPDYCALREKSNAGFKLALDKQRALDEAWIADQAAMAAAKDSDAAWLANLADEYAAGLRAGAEAELSAKEAEHLAEKATDVLGTTLDELNAVGEPLKLEDADDGEGDEPGIVRRLR